MNDLPDNAICNIAIYADNNTWQSKCDEASDIWYINWRWLLNLNLTYMTFWTESANDLLISVLEKPNLFHLTGTIKLF